MKAAYLFNNFTNYCHSDQPPESFGELVLAVQNQTLRLDQSRYVYHVLGRAQVAQPTAASRHKTEPLYRVEKNEIDSLRREDVTSPRSLFIAPDNCPLRTAHANHTYHDLYAVATNRRVLR